MIHFRSKPTPIHGPVNKSELIFSYLRSHFSYLIQAVSKGLINSLSNKLRYAYIMIGPVINVFSLNEGRSHLHTYYHSIITFGIMGFF